MRYDGRHMDGAQLHSLWKGRLRHAPSKAQTQIEHRANGRYVPPLKTTEVVHAWDVSGMTVR